MSTSKHPPPGRDTNRLPADDLACDPGIKRSRGLAGATEEDLADLEGENTMEGDIENDVGPNGEVNPRHRGRTGH
jgi:hypothetical protein